ncbi:MAG: system NifU family Fe-S cluster assembly protein [Gammaproteobacteria bacterium]|jgi:nitrogen fixation NifU-like protein|nr:system NifU family Fe-S cluster assembly protein [Gammaproteobacteria bacterium]
MLSDLYQDIIVDHTRSPRNYGKLDCASHHAEGHNPLCGDQLELFLHVNDQGVIEDLSFTGSGCSISTASASLMTEALKGKTLKQAEALFEHFHALLTQENAEASEDLGKLIVFMGVKDYPSRVKCATLAWHTLQAALKRQAGLVSTE